MPRGFSAKYMKGASARRLTAARKKRSLGRLQRAQVARIAKRTVLSQKETHPYCQETSWSVGTSANYGNLLAVAQGTGAGERVGDTVNVRSAKIRYTLYNASTTEENIVRVMLIQLRKGQSSMSTAFLPSVLGCWDQDRLAKVRVLYDRTHVVRQYDTGIPGRSGMFFINRFKFIKPQWDEATTTGVAPDVSGGIYLCAVSDSAASAHPVLHYGAEVKYKDD